MVWYEVSYFVHDSWGDSAQIDDWEDAVDCAETLAAGMEGHPDTAWWSIQILPHWCDPKAPFCDCEKRRRPSEEAPYKSFRGLTGDELIRRLENRLSDF